MLTSLRYFLNQVIWDRESHHKDDTPSRSILQKGHGRKKCFLPACLQSQWQAHLSCPEVFLHKHWNHLLQGSRLKWRSVALSESSGLQHQTGTSGTSSLTDWTLTRFSTFPSWDSRCWTTENKDCKPYILNWLTVYVIFFILLVVFL